MDRPNEKPITTAALDDIKCCFDPDEWSDGDFSDIQNNIMTVESFIDGQPAIDMEVLKLDTLKALSGKSLLGQYETYLVKRAIDYLAAQGLLHSADKIILNCAELDGMKQTIVRYQCDGKDDNINKSIGWNACIDALIAKAKN